ncbi:translation initiation factor IF-2-like [Choloepus didactylus]|uniref:translation initiation factor IF-2-like n=1 Tax=Choloepus didactylus TaxID=27675 RepID=UPI00189E5F87|nr:translation initiation factor IF-2-like [Choloepus didactylus]
MSLGAAGFTSLLHVQACDLGHPGQNSRSRPRALIAVWRNCSSVKLVTVLSAGCTSRAKLCRAEEEHRTHGSLHKPRTLFCPAASECTTQKPACCPAFSHSAASVSPHAQPILPLTVAESAELHPRAPSLVSTLPLRDRGLRPPPGTRCAPNPVSPRGQAPRGSSLPSPARLGHQKPGYFQTLNSLSRRLHPAPRPRSGPSAPSRPLPGGGGSQGQRLRPTLQGGGRLPSGTAAARATRKPIPTCRPEG